jgi:hypothetical protein
VPAGAGSFFTLEHSHEVLGRFTIQLLGSFVTNDNGRFAAFAADTLFLEAVLERSKHTPPFAFDGSINTLRPGNLELDLVKKGTGRGLVTTFDNISFE